MQVTKPYMFVRIDKKAQTEKREKLGSILISPMYTFMGRNLQYGELLQIGDNAQKRFPEARCGDTVLFHHFIEGEGSDDERLIDTMDNGDEIRYLDGENINKTNEVFAIIKKDNGELIPGDNYVFLHTVIREIKKRPISSIILNDESLEEDDDDLLKKIEDLTTECEKLKLTLQGMADPAERHDITKVLDDLYGQRERITNYLNATKLADAKVFSVNKRTARELEIAEESRVLVVKDTLYPLEIWDQRFLITTKEEVLGRFN